jgi:hypothetical protein
VSLDAREAETSCWDVPGSQPVGYGDCRIGLARAGHGSYALFHEAATRGWGEDELRQLARMWSEESGASGKVD